MQYSEGKIHEQAAQNEMGEMLWSNLRRIEVASNKQTKKEFMHLFKITFIFHYSLL